MTRILEISRYLLVGICIVFTLGYLHSPNLFPIHTVWILGGQHIDHADIREAVLPFLQRGFFNIHIDEIRERLLQQPWVSEVVVHRTWPDRVEIQVLEKKAVARWGKNELLSDTGVLFVPTLDSDLKKVMLPQFQGPDGQHVLMLNYFNQMNRLLTPLHVKILNLELSSYQNWRIELENGTVLQIGHKDLWARLNRFVKVYPKIIGNQIARVQSVDLRYPNGIAVQWTKNES